MEKEINDEFILNYFYATSESTKINGRKSQNVPADIQEYLDNRFPDAESNKEVIMRIKYGPIEERPKCPICGKPVRWYGHSSNRLFFNTCCHEHEVIIRKQNIKKAVKEKYNVDNVFQLESVKEKSKQTCKERFGTENPMQSEVVKNKLVQTCLVRHGVRNGGGSKEAIEKIKQTNLRKFGVSNHMKTKYYRELFSKIGRSEEVQKKRYETRKANNTFVSSNPENVVYQMLIEKFGKENVLHNYKSNLYPFQCDFYVIPLKLYIEYQGTWLHGMHPFDESNQNDLNILDKWKNKDLEKHAQYKQAIYIWTINDPLKRKTAQDNNLNYLELWNINDAIQQIDKL